MGAEHEWAGDAGVRAILDGLGMALPRTRRCRSARCPAASAAGSPWPPCWSASPTCSSSTSPPTTSTSPASTGSPDYLLDPARRRRGRHPRPVVPRRGLHRHLGGRRPGRADLRGRLRRVDPGPRRTSAGRRHHRGPPAEPAPQGDRLAAPRPAGPHLQAAVPDRRGERADRRRAAACATRSACNGWPPPGSASRCTTSRTSPCCAGTKTILTDLTWQVGPGDRIAIVGANGAGKTTLLRLLAGVTRRRRGRLVTGSTVKPAFLSQELDRAARTPAPARGRRGRRPPGQARRPGTVRRPARRGVRLHRQADLDPGQRPVRR